MLRNVVPKLSWKWIVVCLIIVCVGMPTYVGLRALGDEKTAPVESQTSQVVTASADQGTAELLCARGPETERVEPAGKSVKAVDELLELEMSADIVRAKRVPSTAFLSSLLMQQELGANMALQVQYTTERIDVATGKEFPNRTNIKYARTSSVLISEDTDEARGLSGEWSPGRTNEYRYDRASGEQRQVEKNVDGNLIGVTVTRGVQADRFVRLDQMETAAGYLFLKPLYEAIADGAVSRTREPVDDHYCWKVEVPPGRFSVEKHLIWLDPEIGFCPRRIDLVHKDPADTVSIRYSQYKEIAEGIWFPMEQSVRMNIGDTQEEYVLVCKVRNISIRC